MILRSTFLHDICFSKSVKYYKTERKRKHHHTITNKKILIIFLQLHSNNLTDPNLSLTGIENLS